MPDQKELVLDGLHSLILKKLQNCHGSPASSAWRSRIPARSSSCDGKPPGCRTAPSLLARRQLAGSRSLAQGYTLCHCTRAFHTLIRSYLGAVLTRRWRSRENEDHCDNNALPHTALVRTICVFLYTMHPSHCHTLPHFHPNSARCLAPLLPTPAARNLVMVETKSLEELPQNYKPDTFPSCSSFIPCLLQSNFLRVIFSR